MGISFSIDMSTVAEVVRGAIETVQADASKLDTLRDIFDEGDAFDTAELRNGQIRFLPSRRMRLFLGEIVA
jgi:hypothetical protein